MLVLPISLLVVIIISLLAIIYQDFKYRAIHWIWLVVIFLALNAKIVLISNWQMVLQNLFINVVFLGIQFVLLFVYFSLKNRAVTNIVDKYIGLGDVLFLLAICSAFSPFNFIAFVFCSLFIICLGYVALMLFKKDHAPQIPLAGLFAIGLIVVLVLNESHVLNLNDDSYILNSLQFI